MFSFPINIFYHCGRKYNINSSDLNICTLFFGSGINIKYVIGGWGAYVRATIFQIYMVPYGGHNDTGAYPKHSWAKAGYTMDDLPVNCRTVKYILICKCKNNYIPKKKKMYLRKINQFKP